MNNFYLLNYDDGEAGLYHNKYKALYELLQTYYQNTLKDDLHQLEAYLATLNDVKSSEMLTLVNTIEDDLETYLENNSIDYLGYVTEVKVMD